MTDLLEIIRLECLPRRNCMLTVFETQGESGFLYFKDGQLIEVNTGKFWAKDALQTIIQWEMASHNISELPRGIKRSLWEPLDQLIEEMAGSEAASGIREAVGAIGFEPMTADMPAANMDVYGDLIAQVAELQGFIALLREDGGSLLLVHGNPPGQVFSADWFNQFTQRATTLGESLGAGMVREWYLETDECRAWRIELGSHVFIVLGDPDVYADEFEENFRRMAAECL